MGIAELRNQTQLQMPLKKLALPGEAPSPPPAPQPALLGGDLKFIFFPFEELDLLKHGVVQTLGHQPGMVQS